MTIRYLLPCACGVTIPVDAGQAGDRVVCQCGAALDVPTLRQLGQLDIAAPAVETRTRWGPRQGVFLLAAVVASVAGAVAGYLWAVQPKPPERYTEAALQMLDQTFAEIAPLQSWELWHDGILGEGLVYYESPAQIAYDTQVAARRRWSKVSLVVAGIGLLTLLSAVLLAGDAHR